MKGLLRSTALVGAASVLSRILGFVRDLMAAAILGTGPAADALYAALRLPNALRRALGEGGVNAAVTPIYLALRRSDEPGLAGAFVRDVLTCAAGAMAAAAAGLALAAPILVEWLAPGLSRRPEAFALAAQLFMLLTPFAAVGVLASIAGAFLNAERRYILAAFAPLAMNAVLACAWWIAPLATTDPVVLTRIMAISFGLGGLVQLALVLRPALALNKIASYANSRRRELLLRTMVTLAPALAVTAGPQIILIAAAALASASPGAIAAFQYAERLFQLPLAFVGAAAGSVLLAELSRRDLRSYRTDINLDQPLAWGLGIALPAAAGLHILAEPIVRVLFERGAFSAADARETSLLLSYLAPGLPAAVAVRILQQTFLARSRVMAPLLCTGLATAATLASVAISGAISINAMPGLAATIGLAVLAVTTGGMLMIHGWWRPRPWLFGQLLRQSAAVVVMSVGLIYAMELMAGSLSHHSVIARAVALAVLCSGGAIAYFAALVVLSPRGFRKWLRRRSEP